MKTLNVSLKDINKLANDYFSPVIEKQQSTLLRVPIEGQEFTLLLHLAPAGKYQMFWPKFPRALIWDDLVTWQMKTINKPRAESLRSCLRKASINLKMSPFLSGVQSEWLGSIPSYTEANFHACQELLLPNFKNTLETVQQYLFEWESAFPTLAYRKSPDDEREQPSVSSATSPNDAKILTEALQMMQMQISKNQLLVIGDHLANNLAKIVKEWSNEFFENALYFECAPSLVPAKMQHVVMTDEENALWSYIEELRVQLIEKFLSPLFHNAILGYLQNLDRHKAVPISELPLEQVTRTAWINPAHVERLWISALEIERRYPILTFQPLRGLMASSAI